MYFIILLLIVIGGLSFAYNHSNKEYKEWKKEHPNNKATAWDYFVFGKSLEKKCQCSGNCQCGENDKK